MTDYASQANTDFHDPCMSEHVVSSMMDVDTWILLGSRAAASGCPRDFAPDWPLLPLSGKPPPLKSISGQPSNVYGPKLIEFELDSISLWLHFYVCDVPYTVLSVSLERKTAL